MTNRELLEAIGNLDADSNRSSADATLAVRTVDALIRAACRRQEHKEVRARRALDRGPLDLSYVPVARRCAWLTGGPCSADRRRVRLTSAGQAHHKFGRTFRSAVWQEVAIQV